MPSIPGDMQMQQGPPGPMTQLLQQDGPPPSLHSLSAPMTAPGGPEVSHPRSMTISIHNDTHPATVNRGHPPCRDEARRGLIMISTHSFLTWKGHACHCVICGVVV